MLKVEIRDANVNERTIQTQNGPMLIRSQTGRVQLPGESETRPVQVSLQQAEEGYSPGTYMLDPASFFVGQYDRLQVGRVRLASPKQQREQAAN